MNFMCDHHPLSSVFLSAVAALGLFAATAHAAELPARLLVEAESFADHGGWKLDTQFTFEMGSCYLLAHGLGQPVADARTLVEFPRAGEYHVFVRTLDWVAKFGLEGAPGAFLLAVANQPLQTTFGMEGAEWHWQRGGTVRIDDPARVPIIARDLTGFNGRFDAIYFTTDPDDVPPDEDETLSPWRRALLGQPEEPATLGPYDLVVVGGGYSGLGAAISGARQGLKVALIQDRPVLGGNGSSEIRVWSKGRMRIGKYPAIGDIISEIADTADSSPGPAEAFGDDVKLAVVQAEPNIDLFLNNRAYDVVMDGDRIEAVNAFDTRTVERKRFAGRFFADTTGHGWVGIQSGADYEIAPEDVPRLGSSNQWMWETAGQPSAFPREPWMLDLEVGDFPYPYDGLGHWQWESGFFKDTLRGMEAIRDWNFCAVFGAFAAMKNGREAEKHRNARLQWVAYVAGTRESARLMGDYILNEDDLLKNRQHRDGTFPASWPIDIHFPGKQWGGNKKYPDNPFIPGSSFRRYTSETEGYPVPYRTLYSRNIENLFMAGRNISVTREALGSVRVMQTCGMAGEVVGKAAAVAVRNDTTPRGVYEQHWDELDGLLQRDGRLRRDTLDGEFYVRADSSELPPAGIPYIDPASLPGVVVCDDDIQFAGNWFKGVDAKNFVGVNYYRNHRNNGHARFEFEAPESGRYDVRLWYLHSDRHTPRLPAIIRHADGRTTVNVDTTRPAPLPNNFISLGHFAFRKGETGVVHLDVAHSAPGRVVINSVHIVPDHE